MLFYQFPLKTDFLLPLLRITYIEINRKLRILNSKGVDSVFYSSVGNLKTTFIFWIFSLLRETHLGFKHNERNFGTDQPNKQPKQTVYQ